MRINQHKLLLSACMSMLLAISFAAQAAIPANGTYSLICKDTPRAIDTLGGTTNGSRVGIWGINYGNNQKFVLSGTGKYLKLQCVSSGKYLDSLGATTDGSPLGQWDSGSSNNQQWEILDAGEGWYQIINRANGKALDSAGLTDNGSFIQMWTPGNTDRQLWQFSPGSGSGSVTFYTGRSFTGTASQTFGVGTYTMAQMVAKGCPNDSINSFAWTFAGWGSHSVLLYGDDNFAGSLRVYTIRSMCTPASSTSSIKIQTGVPAGYTYASDGSGLTEFQSGFLLGDWEPFHRGNFVTLNSSGGASSYTVRYETEYWQGSGTIVPPSIQVLSGSNTLTGTSGTSDPGTCTGTAFPWEAYYDLNGSVKWTDNENGCAMNLGIRDGHS